jgi:hypothetical protein
MFDNLAGLPNPLLLTKLAYFVSEREHVRREREAGATRPWTEDLILDRYRFCNVRRRDDRVSAWIIKNIIEPYKMSSNLWFQLCCARLINWPPTIQGLMDEGLWPTPMFDPVWFGNYIDERVASGQKTWTGAYIITARHVPEGMGKGLWVAQAMLENALKAEKPIVYDTVELTMEAFKGLYGFGTFMAGQVVADLTYSPQLSHASDLYTYAPIGPGSTRGLNRLFGRKLEGKISQAQFNDELQFVAREVSALVDLGSPKLTLHDWQNCMCEYDKYLRADNGTGRPRSTYKPETAF